MNLWEAIKALTEGYKVTRSDDKWLYFSYDSSTKSVHAYFTISGNPSEEGLQLIFDDEWMLWTHEIKQILLKKEIAKSIDIKQAELKKLMDDFNKA